MSLVFDVEANGLIYQLSGETIVEYSAEEETVLTIITALLALQRKSPAITLGYIDTQYQNLVRSLRVDGDNIFRGLLRLRATVGGWIEVDNDRRLNWTASIGEDKGQQLRYEKNILAIERSIDYDGLCNILYAYGSGEGDARISLATGYIEDAGSKAAYGDCPDSMVNRSITKQATLQAWAEIKLEERKDPFISYRVESVAMNEIDPSFNFEKLILGSMVTIYDAKLGFDVSARVVRIDHPDLRNPHRMQVELANKMPDLLDDLSDVEDEVDLGINLPTPISPDLVIIDPLSDPILTLDDFIIPEWPGLDGGMVAPDTIPPEALTFARPTTKPTWWEGGMVVVGVSKKSFLCPLAWGCTGVYAQAVCNDIAPEGADIIIDILYADGSYAVPLSIFGDPANRLRIPAGFRKGWTDDLLGGKVFALNGEWTMEIIQVGSTIPGSNLTVTLVCEDN